MRHWISVISREHVERGVEGPWRRAVDFASASPAPISPLLTSLSFVPDRRSWGMVFRRGLFEIPADDFAMIAEAMGVDCHG